MEADARRQQEAKNERKREHEEQIRRMANDYQLNARIAELEQAEDEVPEDPNRENEDELPVEIVNEKCEGTRHDDDDVADDLPEFPIEAAVAINENGQN